MYSIREGIIIEDVTEDILFKKLKYSSFIGISFLINNTQVFYNTPKTIFPVVSNLKLALDFLYTYHKDQVQECRDFFQGSWESIKTKRIFGGFQEIVVNGISYDITSKDCQINLIHDHLCITYKDTGDFLELPYKAIQEVSCLLFIEGCNLQINWKNPYANH